MDDFNTSVITETELSLPLFIRGKVRDTYDLGSHLLIVATDRISAFDVVLPCAIPAKGHVLNRLSAFWFRRTNDLVPNHMTEVVDNIHCLDSYLPADKRFAYPEYLRGRAMIVKKVKRIPIECVVRGYISGSAWAEYKQHGTVSGNAMPQGMVESQELEQPIFTPTTKAETGHDEPVTMDEIVKLIGLHTAKEMEEKSLELYKYAREYARKQGIIIADTKFEFGIDNGRLTLIDEALTPDSSRFWDAGLYEPGKSQPSYDKQPVRDWLSDSGWNKEPPAPMLPPDVIEATTRLYVQAYEKITGRKLVFFDSNP
jgi:phosphoribosylaminoimidazole-succinocarboxamide synthase